MYYTYAHFTLDTDKLFYIGKGKVSKGNTQRYKQTFNRNRWWHNKVNKHGFKYEVLCQFKTEEEALEHEKFLIKTFKDLNYELVNLTNGGEGSSGRQVSVETREKLSKAHSGRKQNLTPEEKAKRAERALVMAAKNKGKRLSEEHRKKISKNHKPPKIILATKDGIELTLCGIKDMYEKGFDPSRTYRALRENTKYKGFTFKEIK
jgi:hypothetical protein